MNNSKVCAGCCEVIHRLTPDSVVVADSGTGYQSKTVPRNSSANKLISNIVHSGTVKKIPTEQNTQKQRFGDTLAVDNNSKNHKSKKAGLSKKDRDIKSQYKHYLKKHLKCDRDRFWPVKVFDNYYHACCFNCFVCYKPVLDYYFHANGLLFCRKHYKVYNENICTACKQPTAGVVEKIHQLTFHTECFSCFYCRSLLNSFCNYALVNNDRLCCYDCLNDKFPYYNSFMERNPSEKKSPAKINSKINNRISNKSNSVDSAISMRAPPYTHEIFHINFNMTGLNESRFPLYSFIELRICNIKKMDYYNYLATDEIASNNVKKRRKKSTAKNATPTLAIGGRNSVSFKKSGGGGGGGGFGRHKHSQSMSNRLELITFRAANATGHSNKYFLPGDRVMQIDYTYAGSYMKKLFEQLFLYTDVNDSQVNSNNNEHILVERVVSDLPKMACTYRPSVRSSKSLDNINNKTTTHLSYDAHAVSPLPRISADGYKRTSSSNTTTTTNAIEPRLTCTASSTAANNSSNAFDNDVLTNNTNHNDDEAMLLGGSGMKGVNYQELLNSNNKNININYGYYNKLLEIAARERGGSNDSRLATMKIKNKMAKYRDALKRCRPVVYSMQNLAISPTKNISTEQIISKIGESGIIKPILPVSGDSKYKRKLTDYGIERVRKTSESMMLEDDKKVQKKRKSQIMAPKTASDLFSNNRKSKSKSSEGTEHFRRRKSTARSSSDRKTNVQVKQKSVEYFESDRKNKVVVSGQENQNKKLTITLSSADNTNNNNANFMGGGILTANKVNSNSANVINEVHNKVHRGKNVFNEVERSNSYSNLKNIVSKQNFSTFNRTQSQIYKNNAMVFTERDLIVMEVLGEGFFGQAVKVVNRKTDEVFVLKRLKNFSSDAKSQFRDEVQLMKSLDHRNLVRFIGVLIQRESLDVVIEYIAGGTLRKTIKEATEVYERNKTVRLAPKILYKVAQGIASGMAYLHSKDIAHRDLTSKNCLLRDKESYDVVVADFGLSRVICSRSSENCMEVVGSPYWMAPEMLNGQSYDLNVDIYSYGIILCELTALTKAGPDHLPRLETENFALDRERYLQMVRPQSPQYLCQLAFKCCDVKPNKRPAFTKIAQILLNKLDAL